MSFCKVCVKGYCPPGGPHTLYLKHNLFVVDTLGVTNESKIKKMKEQYQGYSKKKNGKQ